MAMRFVKGAFLAGVAAVSAREAPMSVALVGNLAAKEPVKGLHHCAFCNQLGSQALGILVNFLGNYGVPDSCELLCAEVPEKFQSVCSPLCQVLGLVEFVKVLSKVTQNLDLVYFCEELKQCRAGPDNAKLSVIEAIAQPTTVAVGSAIDLGAVINSLNQTGVSTIQITVAGNSETALVSQGFAPGEQAVAVQYPIQNTETQTWSAGSYPFSVTICQGTCGSKAPHTIDFGTVSGTFTVTVTETPAVSSKTLAAAPVVSKGVLASQVGKVPFCEFCNQLTNQAVSTLVNALLNYGVPDSCEVLCSHLKPNLQNVCSVVCEVAGLAAFIKGLNNLNVDTIYLCEELHACKAGPDNAKVLVQSAIVQPTTVAIGGTIELGAVIDTQVATGVSEVEVVIGGIVETALVPDGFTVGQQAVALQIPVQNSETVQWEAGLTNFSVSICQGTCGSKHPHSIVFGTVSGQFTVTETALTPAAVVV